MSTPERVEARDETPFWRAEPFWERLHHVESRHQDAQVQHEAVRRELTGMRSAHEPRFPDVWRRYCAVIEQLDHFSAEIESLRLYGG
ncbi:MAG TPA: hypothetical protein VMB48_17000 [Steroidobacteraceae bacterium]|nr:hypothetical protein [Steroidobacteraceae bacterium]